MIILGIDPGVATVGFGIIKVKAGTPKLIRYGVVTTSAKMRLSLRLKQIHDDVAELIKLFEPDAIAVEELFFNSNQKTGIAVAHGRAAVLLSGQEHGIPMYEYTPLQVKKAIAGYGRAPKKQMMDMVRRLLEMEQIPKPDDAADALAIALCHARVANSGMNFKGGDICSTI